MPRTRVNGILVIYHHYLMPNASMIMEHVDAFQKYSQFKAWSVNVELGFPKGLKDLEFDVVILHYSLFGWRPFYLDEEFDAYLRSCEGSYKIAFFQDEYRFWPERSAVLNQYEVDCVYTCLEPAYFAETYERFTQVPRLVSYIPGYVSEATLRQAEQVSRPDDERPIDIGYRGRQSYYYMGLGAQEKHVIGERFRELASDRGLVLDIETAEHKRIYGEDWLSFLGDCRATLGAEAGVSIFDMDDVVMPRYEALLAAHPEMTFEEMSSAFLSEYEDQGVYYRTISPRVFEAAAVRTCQILFEGKYSGVVEPMEHYIPLRKDFSNFEEVLKLYGDAEVRRRLSENAYRDLIASGRYTYQQFVASFDEGLLACGLKPKKLQINAIEVAVRLKSDKVYRKLESRARQFKQQISQSMEGSQFAFVRRLKTTIQSAKKFWQ